MKERTDILDRISLVKDRYSDEVIPFHKRLFRDIIGLGFVFVGDNTCQHRSYAF